MQDALSILGENQSFLLGAYNLGPLFAVIAIVMVVDLIFKAWAMWRAARMQKPYWFVSLLLINSAGVLPAIFLLMTNDQYRKIVKQDHLASADAMLQKAKEELQVK